MVICLEQGADLHMAQLMPLPLTVSCSSKIQIGFTFLVPAHLGSPGHRAVKRVCVLYVEYLNAVCKTCSHLAIITIAVVSGLFTGNAPMLLSKRAHFIRNQHLLAKCYNSNFAHRLLLTILSMLL